MRAILICLKEQKRLDGGGGGGGKPKVSTRKRTTSTRHPAWNESSFASMPANNRNTKKWVSLNRRRRRRSGDNQVLKFRATKCPLQPQQYNSVIYYYFPFLKALQQKLG